MKTFRVNHSYCDFYEIDDHYTLWIWSEYWPKFGGIDYLRSLDGETLLVKERTLSGSESYEFVFHDRKESDTHVSFMLIPKEKYICKIMAQLSEETGHISAMHSIKAKPLYQKIKSFGQDAIPHLFKSIKEEDYSNNIGIWTWFCLISEILGDGPSIPEEDRGKLGKVREHYLQFGRNKGYLK